MEFRILGPLEVVDGSDELTPSAPKLRKVLALLVLRRNRIVQTSEFIDELWGDNPPRSALSTLQTYIYKLRQLLTQGRPVGDSELLHTKFDGYLIAVPCEELDVCWFERLTEEGRAALDSGDPEHAAEALSRALSLWRGPALADVSVGELLSAHVTRLEEARLRALEMRLEASLRLGRHHELISELKALILTHPLHEGFHAKLMLALYRSGRRYEALDVYQRLRRLLIEELGLEPSPDLHSLQQALLSSDASLDVAPQVTVAATTTKPDAPAPPAQLPPDIADFIGRGDVLEQVQQRLTLAQETATAVPMVSIIGMPGVGKTVLAVRAAHRVRERYPGGQLFVNLAGSSAEPADPHLLLGQFLSAAGIPPDQVPSGLDERSKLFRTWSAGRSVLILLDDAASAAQVEPLLPGCASCGVIITSRSHGVRGAGPIVLDVPTLDEGVELLGNIVGWRRLEQERQAAESIVRMCGRLPLALRSVGARLTATPGWPLSKLVLQLANIRTRLDKLVFADLNVRAGFAASYERLDEREKSAFRLVSLLQGNAFTAANAAVLLGCHAEFAEAFLARLVESHLLRVEGLSPQGVVHYAFHELARVYAQECLEAELSAMNPSPHEVVGAIEAVERPAGRALPPDPTGRIDAVGSAR